MPLQYRVKSGKLGQTAEFGQPTCLFHSSVIGIKNQFSMQTVKILMRRLKEPSHLDFHCLQMYVRIYLMAEVTRLYPKFHLLCSTAKEEDQEKEGGKEEEQENDMIMDGLHVESKDEQNEEEFNDEQSVVS